MDFSKYKRVHCLGIGGIGLSAVAEILRDRGYIVSGTDIHPSKVTRHLEYLGIKVYTEHKPENVENVDAIVYSAAVSDENPEVIRAKELGMNNIEIFQQACPLFVSLAEEGWWDTEVTRLTAEEYLKPLKEAGVDTLVMACTHYPLLSKVIKEVMGDGVVLVNTGEATARVVKELLGSEGTASEGNKSPVREFYTSDEPELFEQVAAPFLGEGLPSGTRHFTTDKYEVTV